MVKGTEQFLAAAFLFQNGSSCGIEPRRIFKGADVQFLAAFRGAFQHSQRIDAGSSHGNQRCGSEHAVGAAQFFGHGEDLIALFLGHFVHGRADHRGNGDAGFGLSAVFALHHPAQAAGGNIGAQVGTVGADQVQAIVLVFQQLTQLQPLSAGQAGADKQNLRRKSQQISACAAIQFNGGLCTAEGFTAAADHQHI